MSKSQEGELIPIPLDIALCVEYAHIKAFNRRPSATICMRIAEEIFNKPMSMPPYFREWIRGCTEDCCDSILWLKQFI